MKRLFTVMMTLTLAIANWAQDEVKMYSHVYLKLHDGNTYEIPIEHGSKMHSYAIGNGTDAYFVVDITGKKCFYQFKREEIAVMKLIQDVTGIELLDYNSEDPHASMLQYKLGELRVHATLEGEQLTIVDAQGKMVYSDYVEEPYALSLGFLPEGVYVAKVNEHTLKIKK